MNSRDWIKPDVIKVGRAWIRGNGESLVMKWKLRRTKLLNGPPVFFRKWLADAVHVLYTCKGHLEIKLGTKPKQNPPGVLWIPWCLEWKTQLKVRISNVRPHPSLSSRFAIANSLGLPITSNCRTYSLMAYKNHIAHGHIDNQNKYKYSSSRNAGGGDPRNKSVTVTTDHCRGWYRICWAYN